MSSIEPPADTDEHRSEAAVDADAPQAVTMPEPAAPHSRRADELTAAPDSLAGLGPAAGWGAEQYGANLTGSGRAKLVESRVAPAVAVSRGYFSAVPDGVRDAIDSLQLGHPSSKAARQLRDAVGSQDALVMPWARLDEVMRTNARGVANRRASSSSIQMRPHPDHRPPNRSGDPMKYVNIVGAPTVLSAHPATPEGWFYDSRTVLVTEGLIKADSALTAALEFMGAPADLLADAGDPGKRGVDQLTKLHDFMVNVPVEDRVLVVALVGVSNWHRHPERDAIHVVKDAQLWIAFDGDVTTNANVWREAKQMFDWATKRKFSPRLVSLDVTREASPGAVVVEKVGIDDYLALIGTWESLTQRLDTKLPDQPVMKTEYPVGSWRVGSSGDFVEEFSVAKDDEFGSQRPTWSHKVDIGGRIAGVTVARAVTPEEMESGELDRDAVVGEETEAVIDLVWTEVDGKKITATAHGPATLLAEMPDQWHRRGGQVPATVLNHPSWPPTERKWLGAIKANRREETAHNVAWSHMGWVPIDGGTPVFVVGSQVIGPEGFTSGAVPGVTDRTLPGSSKFGVELPDSAAQAREDLRAVLKVYLGGVWGDPRVAALVLATAFRPVAPQVCRAPVLLTGAASGGKTWTASAMMAFWQSVPGAWAPNKLPGAAADTGASTENAVSRAPIWVADDLAPNPDQRAYQMQEAKMSDIVRAIHNGSAKRRMNADMTSRETLTPRATFIATAENPLSVASAMSRLVHVPVSKGFLAKSRRPTDLVNRLRDKENTPSRVTGAALQMMAGYAAAHGWPALRAEWVMAEQLMLIEARDAFGGGDHASRHAGIAADIGLGLFVLERLAEHVGLDPLEIEQVNGLRGQLYQLVGDSFVATRGITPGQQVVRAVRSVLGAGYGHLTGLGVAGPPVTDSDQRLTTSAASANQRIGWPLSAEADAAPRPAGRPIGNIVYTEADGPVAVIDPITAFNEAKRMFPDLLPPGSSQQTAWSAAWDEGFCSSSWQRKRTSAGALLNVVRVQCNGSNCEGVPIPLSMLLDLDPAIVAHDADGEELIVDDSQTVDA